MSVMSSIDGSEPPSPTLGPPTNFAQVVPGIYRSSFPKIGNFEFLGSLGLKTVVYVAFPHIASLADGDKNFGRRRVPSRE